MKKSVSIQEQTDIQAPVEEVFAILTHPEKHLQLGPNWGQARLDHISDDYPQTGSTYRLIPTQADEPPCTTTVSEFKPLRRLCLQTDQDPPCQSSWEIENLGDSVRLIYRAELWLEATPQDQQPAQAESDDPLQAALNSPETFERQAEIARREVVEWLSSIKRYSELRETPLRLCLRGLMDRYILRLRSDQRRIILALIAMQLITCLTFIAAVVGLGLASWLLR